MSEAHRDKLTKDAIRRILVGDAVTKPNLQVLAYKKVSNGRRRRYRFVLSDGAHSHACFSMTGDLVDRLEAGEFERFTVIQLNKYVCNKVAERKTIVILEIDVKYKSTEVGIKIGNPTDLPASVAVSSKVAKIPHNVSTHGISKLSIGCIRRILSGENEVRPSVQMLYYKKVLNDGRKRYRCVISDGIYSHHCCVVIGETVVNRLEKGDFDRFAIMQLNQYVCNVVSGKKILIILDAETKYSGSDIGIKIGNPIALPPDVSNFPKPENAATNGNGIKLSFGSIKRLLNDEKVQRPILQVLSVTEISMDDNAKRYCLCLSDGLLVHHSFLVVNPSLVTRIDKGEIQRNCVIELKQYVRTVMAERKVFLITDFNLKYSNQIGKIGSPAESSSELNNITDAFCELLRI